MAGGAMVVPGAVAAATAGRWLAAVEPAYVAAELSAPTPAAVEAALRRALSLETGA